MGAVITIQAATSQGAGLFQIHKLEVVTDDGVHHPRFELASEAEAKAHMGAP